MRNLLMVSASLAALASTQSLAQSTTGVAPSPPQAAQDQAQPPQTPQDQAGRAEIVITAQRTAQNLQRAAVPVDVVQGAQLSASGTTSVCLFSSVCAQKLTSRDVSCTSMPWAALNH